MSNERATWLYRWGQGLARFCFKNLGRMEVHGAENVPPHGPVILVCNHLSFTDPPLLVASIPRPLHFVGKKELFADPISRIAMRGFHVSPFDRARSGIDAMRVLMDHLGNDRIVVLFPEGHRSPDHSMKEGLLGVVYLALKSQAPLLPVGVTGTEKISGWRMVLPLCRLTSNIGQAFSLPVIEGKPSKEVMQSILDMIMDRIAVLLPPGYRGVYGETRQPLPTDRVTPS